MCFLSVEKSCFPYSSKWVGSHAVSNGQGYRQLRVSVNQPSSLHGQIVRQFPTLSPVAAAITICKEIYLILERSKNM